MSERRAEITQAATDLIVESKGQFPTVREIATRSYLSPAAIYVHFDNVEAIMGDVTIGAVSEILIKIRDSEATSADAALAECAGWAIDNTALLAGLCRDLLSPMPDKVTALINEALEDQLSSPVTTELVETIRALLAPIPMLIERLSLGHDEVLGYLQTLIGPSAFVNSQAR